MSIVKFVPAAVQKLAAVSLMGAGAIIVGVTGYKVYQRFSESEKPSA